MKKNFLTILTVLLVLGPQTACANMLDNSLRNEDYQQLSALQQVQFEHMDKRRYPNENVSDAYAELTAYKTEGYSEKSVAEFNRSLLPKDNNMAELLEKYADVRAGILPGDKNYEFIILTLNASLNELYCEQMNDEVCISGCVKKQTHLTRPLPGEESIPADEQIYEVVLNAFYALRYTIVRPDELTVADRDNTLQYFHTELQNYVEELSEDEMESGNIEMMLTDKANELADNLSGDNIGLFCEIDRIEIHNDGTEIVLE